MNGKRQFIYLSIHFMLIYLDLNSEFRVAI